MLFENLRASFLIVSSYPCLSVQVSFGFKISLGTPVHDFGTLKLNTGRV
jgi:hypothetical protein